MHRDNADTIATLYADVLERTFQPAACGAKPVNYDVAMGSAWEWMTRSKLANSILLVMDDPVQTGQLDSN